jgi:hypothetical protein
LLADLDLRVRIGLEVQPPGRLAIAARVRGDDRDVVAIIDEVQRRLRGVPLLCPTVCR